MGVVVMQPGRAAKGMDTEDQAQTEADAAEVTYMKEVGQETKLWPEKCS